MKLDLDRYALAFWEVTNDLRQLRIKIDDCLELLAKEKERAPEAERESIRIMMANVERARFELGYFSAICRERIEELAPGIRERMARRSIEAFERSERAARQGEAEAAG